MSTMVLNDYGFTRRTSTLKSGAEGKARYSVTIQSEALLIETDPRKLTRGLADATAEHLRQRIGAIGAQASPATIKARAEAAKAVAKGVPSATRRYSGGKIGAMQPNQSQRLFNDSGRLVKSIAVGATKDGWIVNVAGNRFDPTTFRDGEAGLVRMMEQLQRYVPEFGNPRLLMDSIPIRRARAAAMDDLVKKAKERNAALKWELLRGVVGLVG